MSTRRKPLTVRAAAAKAGVTPQRIRQLIGLGTLRGRLVTDHPSPYWLVSARSLAEWMASR